MDPRERSCDRRWNDERREETHQKKKKKDRGRHCPSRKRNGNTTPELGENRG